MKTFGIYGLLILVCLVVLSFVGGVGPMEAGGMGLASLLIGLATVKQGDIYTNNAKTAIPGARIDFRSLSVTTTDLGLNTQLITLGILPAGHRLMSAVFEMPSALDTNNAMTMSVGILNTYWNQALATVAVPAAYNSGGSTDTGTTPALVSGQNILTTDTTARAGGRVVASLAFCSAIGVDETNDRIIAVQFPTAATAAVAGKINGIFFMDIP